MSLQTVTANFQAGSAISAPVSLPGTLVGIGVPSTWTAAALSFQASIDGGLTWVEILINGNNYVLPVAAPSYNLENRNFWGGVTLLIVRSGTVGAPVNQASAVSITLSVHVG